MAVNDGHSFLKHKHSPIKYTLLVFGESAKQKQEEQKTIRRKDTGMPPGAAPGKSALAARLAATVYPYAGIARDYTPTPRPHTYQRSVYGQLFSLSGKIPLNIVDLPGKSAEYLTQQPSFRRAAAMDKTSPEGTSRQLNIPLIVVSMQDYVASSQQFIENLRAQVASVNESFDTGAIKPIIVLNKCEGQQAHFATARAKIAEALGQPARVRASTEKDQVTLKINDDAIYTDVCFVSAAANRWYSADGQQETALSELNHEIVQYMQRGWSRLDQCAFASKPVSVATPDAGTRHFSTTSKHPTPVWHTPSKAAAQWLHLTKKLDYDITSDFDGKQHQRKRWIKAEVKRIYGELKGNKNLGGKAHYQRRLNLVVEAILRVTATIGSNARASTQASSDKSLTDYYTPERVARLTFQGNYGYGLFFNCQTKIDLGVKLHHVLPLVKQKTVEHKVTSLHEQTKRASKHSRSATSDTSMTTSGASKSVEPNSIELRSMCVH